VEWIHFPRIRTIVEKRFHGLFCKKKRAKSGGVPLFTRREHVLAVIHIKTLLDDLKSSKNYCPRKLFSGSNSSPEKSLQKNRSIFVSKIGPATGVKQSQKSRTNVKKVGADGL